MGAVLYLGPQEGPEFRELSMAFLACLPKATLLHGGRWRPSANRGSCGLVWELRFRVWFRVYGEIDEKLNGLHQCLRCFCSDHWPG